MFLCDCNRRAAGLLVNLFGQLLIANYASLQADDTSGTCSAHSFNVIGCTVELELDVEVAKIVNAIKYTYSDYPLYCHRSEYSRLQGHQSMLSIREGLCPRWGRVGKGSISRKEVSPTEKTFLMINFGSNCVPTIAHNFSHN